MARLDMHRATLAMKCEGRTDDQLRQQDVPPSTLSLLGLVRHLAKVIHWQLTHDPRATLPGLRPQVLSSGASVLDI